MPESESAGLHRVKVHRIAGTKPVNFYAQCQDCGWYSTPRVNAEDALAEGIQHKNWIEKEQA